MPLEVRDARDQHLIHRNEHAAPDFDVPELVEETGELTFPAGSGMLRHWYFDGIRLGHARWEFRAPCAQQWRSELDVVHLQFNLRGRLSIEHRQLGRPLTVGAFQHNLMYSPGFEGLHRYEDLAAETFMVQFTRPVFLGLAAQADESLRRFGEQMLAGRPLLLGERSLALTLPLHRAIQQVLDCRLPAPLKKLYLHAKALEILALQAEAFAQARPPRHVRTEYDQERLLFARDYLIQHLHLPPSLPELARIAGLNEFKLKNGFKELFGQPVFAYLAEYRLLEAQAQLIEGRKTASELAFELGYSSLQHFSAAFKKKFGVSPRELR